MKNRNIFIVLIFISNIFLSSCWNYQEIDRLSIVAGIAVDKIQNGSGYHISLEVIDTSAPIKENNIKSKLVESDGDTIYDAISKAKKKLFNKPYFGNTQVLAISHQIAEKEGIKSILEGFFRDSEPRETLEVIISRENSAKEIISPNEDSKFIFSYEIKRNLDQEKKTTDSLKNMQLYKTYDEIINDGSSLVLPSYMRVEQKDKEDNKERETEANGLAVFKRDKLINYLNYEETPYYMFTVETLYGGTFSFPLDDLENVGSIESDVCLTVLKSTNHKSFDFDGEKFVFNINLNVNTRLSELPSGFNLDSQNIEIIEKRASEVLSQRVEKVIQKAQKQMTADIFGLGSMVNKKDYKLWLKVVQDWDNMYKNAEINVNSEIKILRTGFIKDINI